MVARKGAIMLGINDINLLHAQNEGYRKQNEDLQKENKHLKDLYNQALKDYEEALDLSKQKSWEIGNLGYKIHNQRKEINQRLKQIEALNKDCDELNIQLNSIKILSIPKIEFNKYKQALNDILEIVEENKQTAQYRGICLSIGNIINEAKDGNDEQV